MRCPAFLAALAAAASLAAPPSQAAEDAIAREVRALLESFTRDVWRSLPQRQGRTLVWFERRSGEVARRWLGSTLERPAGQPLLPDMARDVVAVRLSPEGRYVAFAVEPPGREARAWSIFDRATGYMLEWRAEDAASGSSLVWRKDSSAVLYIRRGERDALVERGLRSSIATRIVTHGPAPRRLDVLAPEGTPAVFLVAGDDERRSQVWLLAEGRDWSVERVAAVDGAHFEPVHADRDKVVLLTDHGAPRGRVVVAPRGELDPDEWRTLVPEPEAGSRIEHAEWLDGWVAARIRRPLQREVRWHPSGDQGASPAERARTPR